jgi:hypothetical protein
MASPLFPKTPVGKPAPTRVPGTLAPSAATRPTQKPASTGRSSAGGQRSTRRI